MVKHVGKKGDTLVEVTLAVGIFSMVAISVVSVINGSTSSAQTALEATLTREEVDAQAEALRFIHDSASLDESDGPYSKLWNEITSDSNTLSADNTDRYLSNYPPATCSDSYSGDAISGNAFVIDMHALGDPSVLALENPASKVIIRKSSSGKFKEATTYPHLVYTSNSGEVGNLMEEGTKANLAGVEGIYVVAVRDPGTYIVGKGDNVHAYYDFYIRTCWYGAGERKASTISTVIRLYNPTITQEE